MTDAPALPAMFTASVAPVVADIQLFACDQGDESGLDELPPEAMALLFAAMLGVQVAGSPAKAAPGPTSIVTGSADRTAAPGAAAPAAAAAGSAADSAQALEAILRDLLLPGAAANRSELPADETVAGTDAAPAGPDAASLKVVLNGMPGAIDVPTARSPAHDPLSRHAAPVQTPVGAQGWSDEIAGRIAWITRDNLQSASIRLSPEHLGPLDVQISVRDGDAVVSFGASQPETRAALEQALPRLRELLAAQGIALTHANVSDHAARQERPPPSRLLAVSGDEVEAIREGTLRLPTGLVDLYA